MESKNKTADEILDEINGSKLDDKREKTISVQELVGAWLASSVKMGMPATISASLLYRLSLELKIEDEIIAYTKMVPADILFKRVTRGLEGFKAE